MDNNKAQTKRTQYLKEAEANILDAISSLQRAQGMDKGRAQNSNTDSALEAAFTVLSRVSVASETPAGRK